MLQGSEVWALRSWCLSCASPVRRLSRIGEQGPCATFPSSSAGTTDQSLTRPTLTQAPRFGLVNGLGGLRSNGCYGCNGLRVCDLRQVSGLAIGVWACRTSTRVIGIGMDWGLCRQLWARAPAEEKAHGNLERIFRHVPRHRCCLKKIVTTGGSKHNNTKTAERAAFCKQKKDCSPW